MAINVLVVIDGDFQFGSVTAGAAHDLTYRTLVGALTDAGFQVTLAHRSADTTVPGVLQNFVFGASLLDFDVLWLIGREGRNVSVPPGQLGAIDPTQLNAIAAFMEAGGGVFATGDHDSIGSAMCAQIPRVRAMRSWYGASDPAKPASYPTVQDNFPVSGANRADTTLINPMGSYPPEPNTPYSYFENQSDSLPQQITPVPPTHPILRNNGHDVVAYPDHMHEGQTFGTMPGYDYTLHSPFGDTSQLEFRLAAGAPNLPQVIATGQTQQHAVYFAGDAAPVLIDSAPSALNTVNTLSIYDGRPSGVGRIVTGSTFHHYADINLVGDSTVTSANKQTEIGPDARPGHGLSNNAPVFADIKAVYANITQWLARPKPALGLILNRSTFGQAEVGAMPNFAQAVVVTIDGLKPNQFPGGGITALGALAPHDPRAPVLTVPSGVPIDVVSVRVDSDDPSLSDRLQRFTFKYDVQFTGDAFTFGGASSTVPLNATLSSSAVSTPLTDTAWLELVKSANPFMLKLDNGNTDYWLSSDVRVFHVVEGNSFNGVMLPAGASRDQALTFLRSVVASITFDQFTALPSLESDSVLSVAALTTGTPPKLVYNFVLARVRLNSAGGDAPGVRLFFRLFPSPTTAGLTYHLGAGSTPIDGYLETPGGVALPGTQAAGTQWASFPMFSTDRVTPYTSQTDPDNVRTVSAGVGFRIFGALVDNNLGDAYLAPTPPSDGPASLPELLMGEHQCIVAQIEFSGTPLPDGSNPANSDKLSQRNLAINAVANPGLSASRAAISTFEIEATPLPATAKLPYDELILTWSRVPPRDTYLRLHIPSWKAEDVIAAADRMYARHELRAVDAHTIELPGGGIRYVPIPRSFSRQVGVLTVQLPLGIRKGQRFNVSVQQVTNRRRAVSVPEAKLHTITLAEAKKLLDHLPTTDKTRHQAGAGVPRGVFDLGDNRVLVTDLSRLCASGDHAVIIEHPDPKLVTAAEHAAGHWREPIGAFQLGIPVSTKEDMLLYSLQLLSIMEWRTEHLSRFDRWYPAMTYYLNLLIEKVRALGGDPYAVPPTPTGDIPQLHSKGGGKGDHDHEVCHCHHVVCCYHLTCKACRH